jgi:hypothetical protein
MFENFIRSQNFVLSGIKNGFIIVCPNGFPVAFSILSERISPVQDFYLYRVNSSMSIPKLANLLSGLTLKPPN